MGMFHRMKIGDKIISSIDWEMNPDMSFGTFESWGGRERVRNNDERIYYFFVDNWGDEPKLCLMERGVKHARIMAEINAPPDIVRKCVESQGRSSIFEKSYAINDKIKQWLIANVLDKSDSEYVVPKVENRLQEDMGPRLPSVEKSRYGGEKITLPRDQAIIAEHELGAIMKKWNFFEAEHNPGGRFANVFAAGPAAEMVIDQRTGLMWQSRGADIGSIRQVQRYLDECNAQSFGGFSDWRLPTLEEAMSLMEPEKNSKGVHLAPCFSREQPFIFVAAQRKPGGYWFVDFKQGRAFWSSGTIPGGFGRLVRTIS
jgi:hypothetical protein